jgi:hypothetical protein
LAAESVVKLSSSFSRIKFIQIIAEERTMIWKNMNILGHIVDAHYGESDYIITEVPIIPSEIINMINSTIHRQRFLDFQKSIQFFEEQFLHSNSNPSFAHNYIVYSNSGELGKTVKWKGTKSPSQYNDLVTFDIAIALKRIRQYFYDHAIGLKKKQFEEMQHEDQLISFDKTLDISNNTWKSFNPGVFELTDEEKEEQLENLVSNKKALCGVSGRLSYEVFQEWFTSVVDDFTTKRHRILASKEILSIRDEDINNLLSDRTDFS